MEKIYSYKEVQKLVEGRGWKLLSNKYNPNMDIVDIECSNKHLFSEMFSNIVGFNYECKECKASHKKVSLVCENITRNVFESFFGKIFKSARPNWLRNPETNFPLELDGYNEELKIAFEYQGQQHYESFEWLGGDKAFEKIKNNDEIKRKKCKELGINLIEIPYFRFRNNDLLNVDWIISCLIANGVSITKSQIDNRYSLRRINKEKVKKLEEENSFDIKLLNKKESKKSREVVLISNDISNFQRKILNILLAYSYQDLRIKNEHKISLSTIKMELGLKNCNNNQWVKDSFKQLATTAVEWNIFDDDKELEIDTILAKAKVDDNVFIYSFSKKIIKKLHNPKSYINIDLETQNLFTGQYALTLFENIELNKSVGHTDWITVSDWRKLLGVRNKDISRDEFKIFNRDVLKNAVKEINKVTNLNVTPKYFRQDRKIVAIRFLIEDKKLIKTKTKKSVMVH